MLPTAIAAAGMQHFVIASGKGAQAGWCDGPPGDPRHLRRAASTAARCGLAGDRGAFDSDSGSPRSVVLKSILWDVSDPLDQFVANPPTMNEAQKVAIWTSFVNAKFTAHVLDLMLDLGEHGEVVVVDKDVAAVLERRQQIESLLQL